jgi:hypothetical protein
MNLACPARFERATYALEEFLAARMSIYFNGLYRKTALCNKLCNGYRIAETLISQPEIVFC